MPDLRRLLPGRCTHFSGKNTLMIAAPQCSKHVLCTHENLGSFQNMTQKHGCIITLIINVASSYSQKYFLMDNTC